MVERSPGEIGRLRRPHHPWETPCWPRGQGRIETTKAPEPTRALPGFLLAAWSGRIETAMTARYSSDDTVSPWPRGPRRIGNNIPPDCAEESTAPPRDAVKPAGCSPIDMPQGVSGPKPRQTADKPCHFSSLESLTAVVVSSRRVDREPGPDTSKHSRYRSYYARLRVFLRSRHFISSESSRSIVRQQERSR